MRRMWWLPGILVAAVLLSTAAAPSFAMEEKRVTLDLRDSSAEEALRMVFRDTPFSFTLSPEVEKGKKVTLSLNEVPFAVALRAIGNAADLEISAEPDNPWVYVVKPRPMVSVGDAKVPVVGAVTVGPGSSGDTIGISQGFRFVGTTPTVSFATGTVGTQAGIVPPAGPGEKLVDLDVKEAPIREAMAQLAKASGLEITVHPAVSQQIKVTARAFAVPADWLLNTIVDQSHLTMVREIIPPQPAASPEAVTQYLLHPRYRYHIVPPPEIRVTGVPDTSTAIATPTRHPR